MSWNIRGLGDSNECNIVRSVLANAKPSIVCFQETKLHTINVFKAKTFLPPNLASSLVFAGGWL
jgi:exonuclease III